MDFGLTDEQRAVVATTKAFVEHELYPHEEEVERTGVLRPELAEEITAKAIRAGLHAAVQGGQESLLHWRRGRTDPNTWMGGRLDMCTQRLRRGSAHDRTCRRSRQLCP